MRFQKIILLFALTLALLFTPHPSASAATNGLSILVNDTADALDAHPGDGVCLTAGGTCTLRAAIMEANKHPGTDIITLQPNALYQLTRAGQDDKARLGDLDIADSINLIGNGATIDANRTVTQDRALHFLPLKKQYSVSTLEQLTITGGDTTASGGGIWNQAALILKQVTVTANHAAVQGGGIANDGILSLRDSTIDQNDCTCAAAGQPGGGGIANHRALVIVTSTISNNRSHFDGGGIWSDGTLLQVLAGTIAYNLADRHGGAIYTASGQTVLAHATIARNFADANHDNLGDAGGVYVQSGTTLAGHTILADNFNVENGSLKPDDCHGAVGSTGYNIIRMDLNCVVSLSNNWIGFSPGLVSFDNHGGSTKTISLAANSLALDRGNPDDCKFDTALALPFDQRGDQRIADGNNDQTAVCDIGAFESQAAPYTPNCSGKPPKPSPYAPANNTKQKATQALFVFEATCADTYSIVVRQTFKHGPVVDRVKGLTMQYYLTEKLAAGHPYLWRVRACNANGCVNSAWSQFTIKP